MLEAWLDDERDCVAMKARGVPVVDGAWALVHMFEGTARHLDHLNLLREMSDGSTGH